MMLISQSCAHLVCHGLTLVISPCTRHLDVVLSVWRHLTKDSACYLSLPVGIQWNLPRVMNTKFWVWSAIFMWATSIAYGAFWFWTFWGTPMWPLQGLDRASTITACLFLSPSVATRHGKWLWSVMKERPKGTKRLNSYQHAFSSLHFQVHLWCSMTYAVCLCCKPHQTQTKLFGERGSDHMMLFLYNIHI